MPNSAATFCAARRNSRSRLQRLKQEVEGTLRVASIYSVGLSEMVELEKEFARRQPEAKLEVAVSAAGADLRGGAGGRSRTWG